VIEFIVIFVVTTLVLCSLAAALHFGRPPIYQISREEALALMKDLTQGQLTEIKWLVYIGHVITMDPELNLIRLRCNDIELAAEQGQKVAFTAGPQRYDEAGIEQVEMVIVALEKLIADTPISKEF
jgi:hypothetical protein